jgi:hypothetical protein
MNWNQVMFSNNNNVWSDDMFNRENIVANLKTGNGVITFTKKDGSLRVMKCTLQESMIPMSGSITEKEENGRKVNQEVVAVYDLEKKAWRSFRLDSVKEIEFA